MESNGDESSIDLDFTNPETVKDDLRTFFQLIGISCNEIIEERFNLIEDRIRRNLIRKISNLQDFQSIFLDTFDLNIKWQKSLIPKSHDDYKKQIKSELKVTLGNECGTQERDYFIPPIFAKTDDGWVEWIAVKGQEKGMEFNTCMPEWITKLDWLKFIKNEKRTQGTNDEFIGLKTFLDENCEIVKNPFLAENGLYYFVFRDGAIMEALSKEGHVTDYPDSSEFRENKVACPFKVYIGQTRKGVLDKWVFDIEGHCQKASELYNKFITEDNDFEDTKTDLGLKSDLDIKSQKDNDLDLESNKGDELEVKSVVSEQSNATQNEIKNDLDKKPAIDLDLELGPYSLLEHVLALAKVKGHEMAVFFLNNYEISKIREMATALMERNREIDEIMPISIFNNLRRIVIEQNCARNLNFGLNESENETFYILKDIVREEKLKRIKDNLENNTE